MQTSTNRSSLTICLTLLALITLLCRPDTAAARWTDKSDELPGMVSTKTIVLTGLAVGGAITALYLISRSGDEGEVVDEDAVQGVDEAEDGAAESAGEASGAGMGSTSYLGAGVDGSRLQPPTFSVQPIVGFGSDEVAVGFSFTF